MTKFTRGTETHTDIPSGSAARMRRLCAFLALTAILATACTKPGLSNPTSPTGNQSSNPAPSTPAASAPDHYVAIRGDIRAVGGRLPTGFIGWGHNLNLNTAKSNADVGCTNAGGRFCEDLFQCNHPPSGAWWALAMGTYSTSGQAFPVAFACKYPSREEAERVVLTGCARSENCRVVASRFY